MKFNNLALQNPEINKTRCSLGHGVFITLVKYFVSLERGLKKNPKKNSSPLNNSNPTLNPKTSSHLFIGL